MISEQPTSPAREIPEPTPETPPPPTTETPAKINVPGVRCPYCHGEFTGAKALSVCSGCLARHHAACWREQGQCASCSTKEELVPRSLVPVKRRNFAPLFWALSLIAVSAVLIATYVRAELHADRARQLEEENHSLESQARVSRQLAEESRVAAERLQDELHLASDEADLARYSVDRESREVGRLEAEVVRLHRMAGAPVDSKAQSDEDVAFDELARQDQALAAASRRVVATATPEVAATARATAHDWAAGHERTARELLETEVSMRLPDHDERVSALRVQAAVCLLEAKRAYELAGESGDAARLRGAFEALRRRTPSPNVLDVLTPKK